MLTTPSPFRPRLTADQKSDLKKMLLDGVPRKEIAEAFGVSESVVQYYATRVGVTKTKADREAEAGRASEIPDSGPWELHRPQEWRDRAACIGEDPELFYPTDPIAVAIAVSVCNGCPVRTECARDATDRGEQYGIWGGSDRSRRPAARPSRKPVTHGTVRGYWRHKRDWTPSCPECRTAASQYERERKAERSV